MAYRPPQGPSGNKDRSQRPARPHRGAGGPSRAGAQRDPRAAEDRYIKRRDLIFGAVGGLSALAIGYRLLEFQVVKAAEYRDRADEKRLVPQTLYARRGTIYDRNGNVLVSSEDCSNVYIDARYITDAEEVASALIKTLDVDDSVVRALVNRTVRDKETYTVVATKADQDAVDALQEMNVEGIGYESATKRVYPYGSLASQVLGVVDSSNKGISGLELQYEDDLQGENGSLVYERGADGVPIPGGAYEKDPARDGTDLVLGLDANIQSVAEEAIAQAVKDSGAKYGSVVACDPLTGEILAACSYPTFDPNDLENARTEDMNLRVVSDAYEPGSVFKTFVSGAGIDLGLMTPDTEFTVPATVLAGDDPVTDVDGRDYTMTMTLREILRRSSNTGMVLVGEKIGEDEFAEYLGKYGFGAKSGVDFPGESTGIVKDRSEYDGASLGAMSFGQSLAVAPIEVLRAATGLANGGVMSVPHFVRSRRGEEVDWTPKQERAISKDAADQVVSMMRTVVEEGTGQAARIDGYVIAGKTGTAERAGENGYEENNNMASFLGFTSPDQPRAMVYVTLDGTANTSALAMPPFKTVMQACIDALGIQAES